MRISVHEAVSIIQREVKPLLSKEFSLYDAVGHILDEAIIANHAQPPFNRSPYDGYALRAEDSLGASEGCPKKLKIIGKSFAGQPANLTVSSGQAVRIMTGGEIPEGADCVIMQEKTTSNGDELFVFEALKPYDNFIFKGEDYDQGDVLLKKGHVITPAVASVIASVGKNKVKAAAQPKVGVLATGSELQQAETPLEPGQIYNSNSKYIGARLKQLGLDFTDYGQVSDHKESIKDSLRRAAKDVDLLITTGGVSVGEADYLPEICDELAATTYFHDVDMKPGMPVLLAKFEDMWILACSGNPFAAVVNFELLGREILAKLSKNERFKMKETTAVLKNGYPKGRPVPRYVKVHLENDEALATKDQGNGQIRTLVETNALAYLPLGKSPMAPGTEVKCFIIEGE